MEGKLIKWARPALLWVGILGVVVTDIILPAVSWFLGLGIPKFTIDANFWTAWSLAASLYIGGRSWEKIKAKKDSE